MAEDYEKMRPQKEYEHSLNLRESDGHKFYEAFKDRLVTTPCPACGQEGIFAFTKYGFQHKKCPECQTIYTSPRPPESLLSVYYNEYEAAKFWTSLLLKAD